MKNSQWVELAHARLQLTKLHKLATTIKQKELITAIDYAIWNVLCDGHLSPHQSARERSITSDHIEQNTLRPV